MIFIVAGLKLFHFVSVLFCLILNICFLTIWKCKLVSVLICFTMGCLRTRKIKNPKLHPTGFDKPFISIPDGKCSECRKRKTNDYLVRAYFEYISKPQDLFFVTFDYDDEHLPRFEGQVCFNYDDLSKFIYNLRVCAKLPSFRYLIVPHLGDAFDRPHHHAIFHFDKGSVSVQDFFAAVNHYWKCGRHTDIRKVSSAKTPFGLISYVTRYTAQGNNYALLQQNFNLPYKNRAHIYSSIGYGAQCLDPSEFNSKRFLKEGVKFLDTPVITKDYMMKNHLVYIRKDDRSDVLTPFSIPRYYEQKLFFDSHWDPVEKKQSLTRNVDGMKLSENRHNANYDFYFKRFVNSRYNYITSDPFIQYIFNVNFPNSPYNGMMWNDIVDDVLSDKEKFYEFLSYRDYLELYDIHDLYNAKDYLDLLNSPHIFKKLLPRPYYSVTYNYEYYIGRSRQEGFMFEFYTKDDIDLYVQACFLFDLRTLFDNNAKADYRDWQMNEDRKKKIYLKCKSDSQYYRYLISHNFNFNSLKRSNYVSRCSSGEDYLFLESSSSPFSFG